MNRALVLPSPATNVHRRAASEISRVLFTFAYALVGDQPQAEELAIEAFAFACENVSTDERAHPSIQVDSPSCCNMHADLMAHSLGMKMHHSCPSQQSSVAIVALRRFLELPLQERLSVLGCTSEQERALWHETIAAMIDI